MITFDDFAKLEIRIGKIVSAEKVKNADKLLKLIVDFGNEKRQIISGIAQFYSVDALVGRECPFIVNLEPRVFKDEESQGMILAADPGDNTAVLLSTEKEVPPGSKVR